MTGMSRPTSARLMVPNASWRRLKNRATLAILFLMVLLCLLPLVSVMHKLLTMGFSTVNFRFLTNLPLATPKGIGNSIIGSGLILGVASLFAVPLGLLTGLYLSQRGQTHTARTCRLLLDVMSGIPAIVVGMFIYTLVVLPMGGASLLAGGLSLAMIMLPIFARTTEEAVKAIPLTVTEAGLGLGLPRRKIIMRILVRSAMPSIMTGFFLAVARVSGEAAPLLFTALDSNSWPRLGARVMTEQISSLPVTIYELARKPFPQDYVLAWGASLVLVFLILSVRISTNLFVRWRYGQGGAHV